MISSSTRQLIDNRVVVDVVRVNNGEPIIQANPSGWDNRFTLNPTALYLERSKSNDRLITGLLNKQSLSDPRLSEGVVVIFYRGIPNDLEDSRRLRSSVGCAVFTPDLQILRRFAYPVLSPSDDPDACDYDGVEDQRVTRIGDRFYMTYCGLSIRDTVKVQVCMAESDDLVNWRKLGLVKGDLNRFANKNAVLLPKPISDKYVMFHRPCTGRQCDFSVSLALSDSPTGVWRDCGTMMSAVRHPRYHESWVGMGATPMEIAEDVFLAVYHTGNYLNDGSRDYFASFAVLNFRDLDPRHLDRIVESRIDGVIFPETSHEVESPWPNSNHLNCIFPCGSYEYKGDVYIIYGGADAYVLAAKVSKDELLALNSEITRAGRQHVWAVPL